ncbi:MAG TPA: HAMP domain-containing sensor histidine kinase [Kofleriaceae bacterium]|nr:HAMP domain-containing sensor histidine kinase [Kofleriaceae bacterium]
MVPPDHTPPRDRTDDSLRDERKRTDDELLVRSETLAENADALVQRARARAREVLGLAREREDAQLETLSGGAELRDTIEHERELADRALAAEHALADGTRLDERAARRLAILQLLALERSHTDRTLAAERVAADDARSAHEDALGAIAHDLRNLLGLILTSASIIVVKPEPASAIEHATAVQRAGAKMRGLLDDLVDFASIEAGTLKVRCEPVDVVALVRDIVGIHELAAAANGLELRYEPALDELVATVDARRLMRVVLNVLANAIKLTPSGGHIRVAVERIDAELEIRIADTGPGIPADMRESIFDRYTQVVGSPRGAGLGLYIARRIASAHGGRIWVDSELGHGATFRIRLPLDRAPSREPSR